MSKEDTRRKLEEAKKGKAGNPAESAEFSAEEALNKVLRNIGGLQRSFEQAMAAQTERVDKIDERLVVVEKKLGIKPTDKPTDKDPDPKKEKDTDTAATDTDTASKSAKKDEGEAREKDEGDTRAKKEAAEGGTAEKSESACGCIRKAFLYRDLCTGHVYVVADRWAAKQAGHGEYDEVWALYINGQIDHVLTPAEIREIFVR